MNIPSLTTNQMREVDRVMIETFGITLLQMMENAGRNLAEHARHMMGSSVIGKVVLVLCGPGNNGGGGMVAARHLHNWGAEVRVILAAEADRLKEVPARQWSILRAMGLDKNGTTLGPVALVIDALLGYGISSDPRQPIADLIQWANGQSAPVLALDTPSGLDTTSGMAYHPTLRAAATLSLALPKTGLLVPAAIPYVGDLYVADIGVPPELYQNAFGLHVPPLFGKNAILRV